MSTWRPLLEGDDADQAIEGARAVAHDLAARTAPMADQDAREALLDRGQAGGALLFGYLAGAGVVDGAADLADAFLDRALTTAQQHELGPELLRGFAGTAWTIDRLAELGGLEPDDDDPNADIDALLLQLYERPPAELRTGLLSGSVGVGVYALSRWHRADARALLAHVVEHLVATAVALPDGVAWPLRPAIDRVQPERFPDGCLSAGLARGSAGPIALLGAACRLGVADARAQQTLRDAVGWMRAQRGTVAGSDESFPMLTWPGSPPMPAQGGWCFGDIGIAIGLFVAGRGAGEPAWIDEALALARYAARPGAAPGIKDTGLCHGSGGNAHLLHRLAIATGADDLADAARYWYRHALALRRPGKYTGGFPSYSGEPPTYYDDEPGLLYGAAGTALALLSAALPVDPTWDELFLVDRAAFEPPTRDARGGAARGDGS